MEHTSSKTIPKANKKHQDITIGEALYGSKRVNLNQASMDLAVSAASDIIARGKITPIMVENRLRQGAVTIDEFRNGFIINEFYELSCVEGNVYQILASTRKDLFSEKK